MSSLSLRRAYCLLLEWFVFQKCEVLEHSFSKIDAALNDHGLHLKNVILELSRTWIFENDTTLNDYVGDRSSFWKPWKISVRCRIDGVFVGYNAHALQRGRWPRTRPRARPINAKSWDIGDIFEITPRRRNNNHRSIHASIAYVSWHRRRVVGVTHGYLRYLRFTLGVHLIVDFE